MQNKNPDIREEKNLSPATPADKIEIQDAIRLYANPDLQSKKIITLVRPPMIFSKNSYSAPLSLPLGLAYLGAVLEQARYTVRIMDALGGDIDNIRLTPDQNFHLRGMDVESSIHQIDANTDIIGVPIMFSQEWPFIKNYIGGIRKKFPAAVIIVGGEHATAMPEYSLRDCGAIDYLVMGEGELPLLEIVSRIRSNQKIDHLKGVAFLKNGTYAAPENAPRLADISQMPWPAWHLIDLEAYFKPTFTMGISTGRNIALLATRGCPYQCAFCSNPTMWTSRYVMRDVKDVVDEIEHNIKKHHITGVDFYDLTAIVKKEWILALIHEFKQRQIKITWQLPSGTRSEALDHEVLLGLLETGCKFIVYAPESGSQKTLKTIKKKIKLDRMVQSIHTALSLGLIVKVNFIIGFPSETRMDIYKTLFMVWKLALLKTDDCNISSFAPYPGSELFRELEREGVFGAIDKNYFEGLITQFDLTVPKSFCKKVGGVEIMFYRIIGMGLFYILSYVGTPSKLLRLIKILSGHFSDKPRSLFEQRALDSVEIRRRLKPQSKRRKF